jgi:uncharacterized protein (DUF1697 family)
MQTCISLLRGVNMAGHNSIKMAGLTQLYKDIGFNDAETYIQSGNVIFTGVDDISVPEVSVKIEKAILERFSCNIAVMIRTLDEMRQLLSVNPYLKEENFDPSKMAVIFLYEKTTADQIQKVMNIDYPPDKFKIAGSEIFIYCPNGFGRTKLYTNFFEKKMDVTGTARNWKSITTLLQMAEKR